MKKSKQTFDDGDIIFREDDASDMAFEIISGNVEISKMADDGTVRLATLGQGEIFGEMGVLDQGTRSATATAVGPVIVNAIARKDFLSGLQEQPQWALGIMNKMAQRLRDTDNRLAHGGEGHSGAVNAQGMLQPLAPAEPGAPGGGTRGSTGFWAGLLGMAAAPKTERIEIRVAPFPGEEGKAHTRLILHALEKRKGIRVRALKQPLTIDPDTAQEDQDAALQATARKALADAEGDLLIWGEVPITGLTLRLKFITFATWNDTPPGNFGPNTVLPLPAELDEPFADFLHATALAATIPKSEGKAATLSRDLPMALDHARAALNNLHGDLTSREKGWIRVCFANALTTVALQRGEVGLFRNAADAYRECLGVLDEQDEPYEWAMIQKNLGSVLQSIAERTGDVTHLDEAADSFRAALRILTVEDTPMEWAAVQNRLGEVLFQFDFESGDIEMLKHAMSAFQSALQIYTRTKTPMRWADAMNNLAQVTQVLGEQLKNAEALEKAALACHAVLEVRTKSKTPVLWAATQNNLGSALFLLGKLTKAVDPLQGAAEAFGLANSLYQSRGMTKMAAVTNKNLGHVNQLLEQLQPKGVPTMQWEK
ncbi:MAG: cyclic nucleotide-binding domain-containing protein [Rhodospirillales bacterium]|nr:cyclic nucleotide-binding domain-containing protein [Alphaproteobacteria bacterium]MBL6948121.1 cyclic nucleotide-binding domain-containing protein [Rhodospirillales bacterium]